jgi:hypothetical protein
MTTEVTVVHLADIASTKHEISELRERIHKLEDEHGITELREQLSDLEDTMKLQITSAVNNNLLSEDQYQLVNKGRVMTVIDPKKAFDAVPPEIFWRAAKVGKGKLEDQLFLTFDEQGQSRPEAKKNVKSVIDSISSKTQSGENYELIDLLSGE